MKFSSAMMGTTVGEADFERKLRNSIRDIYQTFKCELKDHWLPKSDMLNGRACGGGGAGNIVLSLRIRILKPKMPGSYFCRCDHRKVI